MRYIPWGREQCSSPFREPARNVFSEMMDVRLCRGVLAAIGLPAVLMAGACSLGERSILDQRLEDGRQIREIMPVRGTSALLVLDARTCFGCDSELPLWRSARDRAADRVLIVVIGPVTPDDRRAFILAHLPVAGVVAQPRGATHDLVGSYLVSGGRVTASARTKAEKEQRQLWKQIAVVERVQRREQVESR